MSDAASSWDAEYAAGRYIGEPPVAFVDDIVRACEPGTRGLYIGCGNGRNFIPLVDAGLDLIGLDISRAALDALAARVPGRRLVHGDLSALDPGESFDAVIGIQVFQHGTRAEAHAHVRRAQGFVAPGGVFCLRVNAVGTDVVRAHSVYEPAADGSFTVRYLEGPKHGLDVHFFARDALAAVFAGWDRVLPLRLHSTPHVPAEDGQWSQWEAIWRRPISRM